MDADVFFDSALARSLMNAEERKEFDKVYQPICVENPAEGDCLEFVKFTTRFCLALATRNPDADQSILRQQLYHFVASAAEAFENPVLTDLTATFLSCGFGVEANPRAAFPKHSLAHTLRMNAGTRMQSSYRVLTDFWTSARAAARQLAEPENTAAVEAILGSPYRGPR